MSEIRKLKAVRAIVTPQQRSEYLARWKAYASAVGELEARAWLFEDQALAGRFMEFTEFQAARGMEGKLRSAQRQSGLAKLCVRREGDELLFREVEVESE